MSPLARRAIHGGNNDFHLWANIKRMKNGLQIERHVVCAVSQLRLPNLGSHKKTTNNGDARPKGCPEIWAERKRTMGRHGGRELATRTVVFFPNSNQPLQEALVGGGHFADEGFRSWLLHTLQNSLVGKACEAFVHHGQICSRHSCLDSSNLVALANPTIPLSPPFLH